MINESKKCNYPKAEEEKIRRLLSPEAENINIIIKQQSSSTNEELIALAKQGQQEITLLIAEGQTLGRGTKGRSFFSPEGSGCYMSFLLRPSYTPEECTLLTTAAAAACCLAIEQVTDKSPGIKWVNDIYIASKKVAGVLTQSALRDDLRGLHYAVVGIGINVYEPEGGFPSELQDIATALCSDCGTDIKNPLIAAVINNFLSFYGTLPKKDFAPYYNERLLYLGEEITVIQGDKSYTATALSTDDMCRLTVADSGGNKKTLYGGEISIRKK